MKNLTLITLLLLATVACKKDKDKNEDPAPTPALTCSVDSIIDESSIRKHYYDAQNRLVKVINMSAEDTTIQNIEYTGNTAVISLEGQSVEQVIFLNSKGYMDSLVYELEIGSLYGKVTYDANDKPIQLRIKGEVFMTEIDQKVSYEWANGDIIKETIEANGETNITRYTYEGSKPNSIGAYESAIGFLPSSAHLKTKETIEGDDLEIVYTYVFDSNNKVIKVTSTDPDGSTEERYTWVCK